MFKEKYQKYNLIFLISYFVLNIFNTYFLTSQLLNRYISPLSRTFFGELTAIGGNFSFLLLFYILTIFIFKKDKNRQTFLLYLTLFLNIFILLSGYFTYFYSTVFTTSSLDIFKNPSEGISDGLFILAIVELFVYYRLVVLLPFVVLLVFSILYSKDIKKHEEHFEFGYTLKNKVSLILTFVLLTFVVNVSYAMQVRSSSSFNIKSLSGTRGVQNYGVYPYYITELFGISFEVTTKASLNINSEQQLYDAYNEFNKNQTEYTNFIDGLEYSNKLTLENSIVEAHPQLNLNNDDSLTGIFKDKDLILVHLESLNYFLWEIPEVRERFTFLNKLFEESVVFENYYTNVGMGVSSDAEASVLTGLYTNGYSTLYRDFENKNYDFDTLPKLFSEQNYKSQSIHNDFRDFYNRPNAYKNFIGFTEEYYSIEDFALLDGFKDAKEYMKFRQQGYNYKNYATIISPWPSEFELNDRMYELKAGLNSKSLMFPVYLTQHTPYLFNPYSDQEYENITNYNRLQTITKRYLENVKYIDELIKSTFFEPISGNSRIDSNTVYIFYSDHGSGLNNGDLRILFDENISAIEERRILQQTISFIYAPSDEVDPITNINKGLIKGKQTLTRSHVDLYRTIGDLFDLFENNNPYFGVHGLSKEPTFVFDNRIQDVIIDDITKINNANYKPFIVSFRNENNKYPYYHELVNQNRIYNSIKQFKKLSDLLLNNDTVYYDFKKALQNHS